MKAYLAAVCVFLLAGSAVAAPVLEGEWVSDRERTMAFNDRHAKLPESLRQLLDSMLGKMTMTFADGRTRYAFADHEARVDEETIQSKGFDGPSSSYELLYSDEHVVVLSIAEIGTDKRTAQMFHFDGPDVFWIYAGNSNGIVPDMHIREYFRRVR